MVSVDDMETNAIVPETVAATTSAKSDNPKSANEAESGRKGKVHANEKMGGGRIDEPREESVGGAPRVFLNVKDRIACKIGGATLEMVIDSGAPVNVISEHDYYRLKVQGVAVFSSTPEPNKILWGYASDVPLKVLSELSAKIEIIDRCVEAATFYVVRNGRCSLLGIRTAKDLGVLKTGPNSDGASRAKVAQPASFPKLTGFKVKLSIDEGVAPVFHSHSGCIPVDSEDAVQARVRELLKKQIIEKVSGYSRWASPWAFMREVDGRTRVSLDFRGPNAAIQCGNIPRATIDDAMMLKLRSAKVFSRIAGEDSYHQVELDEDSRELTTFAFGGALYRYTRLPAGLCNAAPDFRHIVTQMLAGLKGAVSVTDDIVVFGEDQRVHDERLDKVMKRLHSFNFVVDRKSCSFGVEELTGGWTFVEEGAQMMSERTKATQTAEEAATKGAGECANAGKRKATASDVTQGDEIAVVSVNKRHKIDHQTVEGKGGESMERSKAPKLVSHAKIIEIEDSSDEEEAAASTLGVKEAVEGIQLAQQTSTGHEQEGGCDQRPTRKIPRPFEVNE